MYMHIYNVQCTCALYTAFVTCIFIGSIRILLPSALARGNINRDLCTYVRMYIRIYVRSSAQARTSRRSLRRRRRLDVYARARIQYRLETRV